MSVVTLKSRIPQIQAEMAGKLQAAVKSGAEAIEVGAKARVPVDEGDLRDAIHTETEAEGTYVIAGNEKVFYGHLVENGTVRNAPQPFLVPAAEAAHEAIVAAAVKTLRGL